MELKKHFQRNGVVGRDGNILGLKRKREERKARNKSRQFEVVNNEAKERRPKKKKNQNDAPRFFLFASIMHTAFQPQSSLFALASELLQGSFFLAIGSAPGYRESLTLSLALSLTDMVSKGQRCACKATSLALLP